MARPVGVSQAGVPRSADLLLWLLLDGPGHVIDHDVDGLVVEEVGEVQGPRGRHELPAQQVQHGRREAEAVGRVQAERRLHGSRSKTRGVAYLS